MRSASELPEEQNVHAQPLKLYKTYGPTQKEFVGYEKTVSIKKRVLSQAIKQS